MKYQGQKKIIIMIIIIKRHAVAEDRFEPRPGRVRLLERIISNNSYAHDDQGDNPGQDNRGLDGVLYKL